MCERKRRLSYQKTMEYDRRKQPKVSERSSRSPKLKLQISKKIQENSTPISKLCTSLASSSITLGKTAQATVEPMLVDTPQKQSTNFNVETPSSTHIDNPVLTSVFTPKCSLRDDDRKTLTCSPLNTPETTKEVPSSKGTSLCDALGKPFKTKNASSTPRRSSRKSSVRKSYVSEYEVINSKKKCRSGSLDDISIFSGHADKNDQLADIVIRPENQICDEGKKIENTHLNGRLCAGSGSSVVPNPLDWLPESLQNSVVNHIGISSEPRCSRKSDFGVYSARRLSFTARKPGNKKKDIILDYDPDNDIFAQGLMPVQFNIDSLKNQIGKILNCADIPSPQLKKSYCCDELNNVEEHAAQQVTPVSSRRKQTKRSPSTTSNATIKRTVSAPDLRANCGLVAKTSSPTTTTTATIPTSSGSKVSSEGKIRALLRARDIIKNIRRRAKTFSSVTSEAVKQPSRLELVKLKGKEIENVSTNSCLDVQKDEYPARKSDLLGEAADDTFFPLTQPFESLILGDVTAYVEVISKNEDISAGVRKELMKLGATVASTFNRDVPVTHVVFSDGHISTYKKARKRNIPLVSVLWIEACRKAGVKVHESLFPPHQIERYESPATVKELKKRKIMRFYSDETQRPSPRQRKGVTNNETQSHPSTDSPDQNNTVRKSACAPKWVEEVAGGNGMVRMLVKMTGISKKEFKEMVNRPPTPDSDIELDQNSPLPVRLLRKLAKTLPTNISLECSDTSKNNEQNDMEAASCTNATYENSFAKKLIEVGGMEEQTEICSEQNGDVIESLPISAANDTSQMDNSNRQNITQRKKVSKRKLLTPVQESLAVTNEDDDVASTIVQNPHSCTPRRLSGEKVGKKRKSVNAKIEMLEGTENKESEIGKATTTRENTSVDPIRRSRRSSSYFVKTKRCPSSPVLQKPALVCTQLHTPDVDLVASVVEQLGSFVVEKSVTSHTTHIVIGTPKRTMKLMKGMARGCWIVSHEWVLRSLEAGKWLDEEEFELITFSPAVQKYRLEKLSFGGIFKPDIFSTCGPIFVSSQSTAPRGDLVELILLCGGQIVSRISKAKIAVGKNYSNVISVTALWILDSIQYYCCKPFDNYQIS